MRGFAYVVAALLTAAAPIAAAQLAAFPDRQILLIIPAAVGSGSDLALRLVGNSIAEDLGKPVVVENMPGASGLMAVERARKSPPDGYTVIGISDVTLIYLPLLMKAATFEPTKDFAPVTLVAEVEWALVTHPSFPANNLHELMAAVKASPQKVQYATGGQGSPQQVAMAYLGSMAKLDIEPVAYKGATPALVGVVAGDVPMMITSLAASLPYIKDGRLRAIATTGSTRAALSPNVPTLAEAGLPGYEFTSWMALGAPVGVSSDRIAVLQRSANKALADPAVKAKLVAAGLKPLGGTPADMRSRLDADSRKLGDLVRSIGIQPE